MRLTYEAHPRRWSILAGVYPLVWSFGLYVELGRAEQELRLGVGPIDLYITHTT